MKTASVCNFNPRSLRIMARKLAINHCCPPLFSLFLCFARYQSLQLGIAFHFVGFPFFFPPLPTSAEGPQRCIPRKFFLPRRLNGDGKYEIPRGKLRVYSLYAKQRASEGLLLQSVELCAKARVIKTKQTSHSTNSAKLCTCIRPGGRNMGKCFETGNEINYLGLPSNFPFASYRHHSGLFFVCVCE